MTTFTLRASEALAGQLSSAEMRSWLEEFLRQPQGHSAKLRARANTSGTGNCWKQR